MPELGKTLRRLILDHHLSQREYAKKCGLAMETVRRALNARGMQMNQSTYRALAAGFGLTPEQLDRQWRGTRVPQYRGDPHGGIPILSEIPATNGLDAQAAHDQGIGEGYVSRAVVGIEDPTAYLVRVTGDSMSPTLVQGDLIACSPAAVREHGFEEGGIYALRLGSELDDEATVKRVHLVDDRRIELVPDNPRHRRRTVRLAHIAGAARVLRRLSVVE